MGFHSPLIRPAISWGGSFGGGTLDSHDIYFCFFLQGDVLRILPWSKHTFKLPFGDFLFIFPTIQQANPSILSTNLEVATFPPIASNCCMIYSWLFNQPPLTYPPPRNKALLRAY